MFKLKAEPLGPVQPTKKGDHIRKFLVLCADGSKEVLTVWAKKDDFAKISREGVQEITVRPGDMVFCA